MKRRILRPLAWLLGGVSASILCLAGVIRLDQYLLRRRAEHLLSDIRSLELRKSTYSDARRVMDYWSDELRQQGPCGRDWCDVYFTAGNLAWRRGTFFANHQELTSLYRSFGGRWALVGASIRVHNGIVWEKSFSAHVESTYYQNVDGSGFYSSLVAKAETGSHYWVGALHPEYQIGSPGGCTGCKGSFVIFTPYADSKDVSRLMNINLACITRWHPCTERADILPTAWREYLSETGTVEDADHRPCTPSMIRVLSREARRVPVATVTRVEPSANGVQVTVHWDEKVKDLMLWSQLPDFTFTRPNLNQIRKGDRLLIFEHACSPIPATEENLKIAKQGVSEDWSDHSNAVYLPIGNIGPPQVDVR